MRKFINPNINLQVIPIGNQCSISRDFFVIYVQSITDKSYVEQDLNQFTAIWTGFCALQTIFIAGQFGLTNFLINSTAVQPGASAIRTSFMPLKLVYLQFKVLSKEV